MTAKCPRQICCQSPESPKCDKCVWRHGLCPDPLGEPQRPSPTPPSRSLGEVILLRGMEGWRARGNGRQMESEGGVERDTAKMGLSAMHRQLRVCKMQTLYYRITNFCICLSDINSFISRNKAHQSGTQKKKRSTDNTITDKQTQTNNIKRI